MFITINAVCKLLSIGRTLVYKLINNRELEAVKLHGRTLITRASVDRLIAAKMV